MLNILSKVWRICLISNFSVKTLHKRCTGSVYSREMYSGYKKYLHTSLSSTQCFFFNVIYISFS